MNGDAPPDNGAQQQATLNAYLINQHELTVSSHDGESEADDATSARTSSTFTQFLRDYSIQTYPPDFVLKIRKRLPQLTFGADVLYPYPATGPQLSLVAKPHRGFGGLLQKMTVNPAERSMEVYTPKWSFWYLRLQLFARSSPQSGVQFAYKLNTAWGHHKRSVYKRTFQVSRQFAVRPHCKIDMLMPECVGSFGGVDGQVKAVDRGHCHVTMPRLNFRWELDPADRRQAAGLFSEAAIAEAAPPLDTDELQARCIVP